MIHHRFFATMLALLLILAGCGDGSGERASIEQLVAEMNQRIGTITLKEEQAGVVPRFNQSKTVACAEASFRVHDDVPDALKHGVFEKPATYPAFLRFANATKADDSEKDIRGLSIRLSGVEGPVLWGREGLQDFLLNSYPALFVATPEEFLSFIRARQEGSELGFFLSPLDPHLKSLWIVLKAREKHLSPLDIRYWSTVAFRLGPADGPAVKYSVSPCSDYRTSKAVEPGENQLRAAITAHLQQGPACFNFGLQTQTSPEAMPIEDATVVWDESESPFVTVATITIPNQAIEDADMLARCERSAFNPWQSLEAHAPVGRMNAVRREVYAAAARVRNEQD
jgi:catalase